MHEFSIFLGSPKAMNIGILHVSSLAATGSAAASEESVRVVTVDAAGELHAFSAAEGGIVASPTGDLSAASISAKGAIKAASMTLSGLVSSGDLTATTVLTADSDGKLSTASSVRIKEVHAETQLSVSSTGKLQLQALSSTTGSTGPHSLLAVDSDGVVVSAAASGTGGTVTGTGPFTLGSLSVEAFSSSTLETTGRADVKDLFLTALAKAGSGSSLRGGGPTPAPILLAVDKEGKVVTSSTVEAEDIFATSVTVSSVVTSQALTVKSLATKDDGPSSLTPILTADKDGKIGAISKVSLQSVRVGEGIDVAGRVAANHLTVRSLPSVDGVDHMDQSTRERAPLIALANGEIQRGGDINVRNVVASGDLSGKGLAVDSFQLKNPSKSGGVLMLRKDGNGDVQVSTDINIDTVSASSGAVSGTLSTGSLRFTGTLDSAPVSQASSRSQGLLVLGADGVVQTVAAEALVSTLVASLPPPQAGSYATLEVSVLRNMLPL